MKKSLVFVHGFASNKHAMDCLIPLCKKLKIDYYSFDLPLHGQYSNDDYDRELSFDDLNYFANRYINSLKLDNIILVGHSMGAAIILKSYKQIKNVSQIVLIDPLNHNLGTESVEQFKNIFNDKVSKHDKHLQELYLKRILKIGLKNSKNLVKLVLSFSKNEFKEIFNSIELDKNINWSMIYGKDDILINGAKTASWLKGLNKDIKVFAIDGAGHNPFRSNESDFVDIMKVILPKLMN